MRKKKVLGKGLGALIKIQEISGGDYIKVPINEIRANRFQPRKTFDEVTLKELADSIKEKGILEPLLVRRNNPGYELIAGERRLRAAKMSLLKDVPVLVMNVSDEEVQELAIIENIQREGLNAIEQAEGFRSLIEKFGLSQEEIAKKVGKERATVANFLRLLKLPLDIRSEIEKGSITIGHAKIILSVEKESLQREICRKILKKGLSVRGTESLVNKFKVLTGAHKSPIASISTVKYIEKEMQDIFLTRVSIKEHNGKGRIEIEFHCLEEFERLVEMTRSVKHR
ncbi:MAG: ParB/RepB/Spo0J family partition protein [Deltaproteobacteria bacterium]|nr:ParB/RepB/Spo0J family partition protein [Deltaproteobacteria bacterium]